VQIPCHEKKMIWTLNIIRYVFCTLRLDRPFSYFITPFLSWMCVWNECLVEECPLKDLDYLVLVMTDYLPKIKYLSLSSQKSFRAVTLLLPNLTYSSPIKYLHDSIYLYFLMYISHSRCSVYFSIKSVQVTNKMLKWSLNFVIHWISTKTAIYCSFKRNT